MPRHTLEETKALEALLDFDETNVAYKGKQYKATIQTALDFLFTEVFPSPAFKTIYKKLGLWYAFYSREKEPALKYLEAYNKTLDLPHSVETAEATNWLGYAYTIDGAYKDAKLFTRAYRLLNELLHEGFFSSIAHVQRDLAFSLRYQGLINHRHAMNDAAQANYKQAINIYLAYPKKADIELAETYHLYAVSLVRQKNYRAAIELLKKAYSLEVEYNKTYGSHYLKFITMQSLAEAKRQLAEEIRPYQNADAVTLLAEGRNLLAIAFEEQLNYYSTEMNADVAKTAQFLGDNYLSSKNYVSALIKYDYTLKLKLGIYHDSNHPIVKFTTDALQKLFTEMLRYFDFDWNDYKKIEGNKGKIDEVKSFVDAVCENNMRLNAECRTLYAKLTYRLSTYYNHYQRDPIAALKYQSIAEKQNANLPQSDAAWLELHEVYSMQQLLFKGKENPQLFADAEKYLDTPHPIDIDRKAKQALEDIRAVGNLDVNIIAFSYCLEALLDYECNRLDAGVEAYRKALDLYESNDLLIDDQYVRAKNRYAQMLCEQRFPLEDPRKIFKELKQYWERKNEPNNPYAKRFYQSYREFLESHPNTHVMFGPALPPNTAPKLTYQPTALLRKTC